MYKLLQSSIFMSQKDSISVVISNTVKLLFVFVVVYCLYKSTAFFYSYPKTIIIITPTHQRPERLGDLTMLAQTLKHVKDIFWIVIEDSNSTNPLIQNYLQSTGIPFAYLNTTNAGLPCRGWAHRNLAFDYLRENRFKFGDEDVVFFADDDNAYDYKVFDEYIRKVKVMGVWAVGTSGSMLVESPRVQNDTVVGWNVHFRPNRKYATDMAGFAINIDVVLKSNASFNLKCAGDVPENCFLRQVNVPLDKLEPFGHNQDHKQIYIWHRRTKDSEIMSTNKYGYFVEEQRPSPKSCKRLLNINHVTYEEILAQAFLGDN